jgi:prepilin peptidase CpaA
MTGLVLLPIDLAVAALFVFAALRDVATRTVPNWVSVAILALAIVAQALSGHLLPAVSLAILVFAIAVLMWRGGWLGGADVKLLGAGTAAVAPGSVGPFILIIALAGGVLALLYLGLSVLVRRPAAGPRTGLPRRILKAEAWRIHRRGHLPYASAIAIGCLFTLFSG